MGVTWWQARVLDIVGEKALHAEESRDACAVRSE